MKSEEAIHKSVVDAGFIDLSYSNYLCSGDIPQKGSLFTFAQQGTHCYNDEAIT